MMDQSILVDDEISVGAPTVVYTQPSSSNEDIDSVISKRWKPETQNGYRKRCVEIFGWMETNGYSEMFTDRELNEAFHIDSFLKFCMSKKKFDKQKQLHVNLSYSGLNKYRSSLRFYLYSTRRTLSLEEEEKMSSFFHGVQKRCAEEKQDGTRPIKEGKAEMPLDIYEETAKYFYKIGDLQHALYLILSWNLACRTNNTESIRMAHIRWHEDALKIEFSITKTNQENKRAEWRLIFANPLKPHICPVLSLSLYLMNLSKGLTATDTLFLGGTPAQTFNKALSQAMRHPEMVSKLLLHGLVPDDIGSHSIRKGAATFLANGSTSAPSYSSICIRLSWALGVQGRYLHYNYAADAYCGRILAGLPQSSVLFSTLSPHSSTPFDFQLTKHIFPSTSNIVSLERVRQFMTASILHHAQGLDFIPSEHNIRHNYLFRNLTSVRSSYSIIAGLHSPVLAANGIPPHILSWLNHDKIQRSINELPTEIMSRIGHTLRENGVASGNITREMLQSMIDEMLTRDRETRQSETQHQQQSFDNFMRHLWTDGDYHRLPENYVFPTGLSVVNGWLLWFEGSREERLPPFRFIQSSDVQKSYLWRLSELRCLMKLFSIIYLSFLLLWNQQHSEQQAPSSF